jgi:hypothetical protein
MHSRLIKFLDTLFLALLVILVFAMLHITGITLDQLAHEAQHILASAAAFVLN